MNRSEKYLKYFVHQYKIFAVAVSSMQNLYYIIFETSNSDCFFFFFFSSDPDFSVLYYKI